MEYFYNVQRVNRFIYGKLEIIKLPWTAAIPPTWWDTGWLQLPGVPMHAGGVNIELEASAAQSTTLLCSTHLPSLEAVVHIPALLIIL